MWVEGNGKFLAHTSGSSVVCDDARGESENPRVFTDDETIHPIPIRKARVSIDRFIREAGIYKSIRAVVVCPTMIYGMGRGLQKDSDQVPKLTARSKERGIGLFIGKGLNRWSNCYIGDLTNLFLLTLEKAPAASFFFVENGEASLKEVAEAVSKSLGFGGRTESWNADDAIKGYGDWARFALASNSRVGSLNAHRLGWSPVGPNLSKALEEGL